MNDAQTKLAYDFHYCDSIINNYFRAYKNQVLPSWPDQNLEQH